MDVRTIPVSEIHPPLFNPRGMIDINQDKLQELAESISAQGIIQPLVVMPRKPDGFHLIAGSRRLAAAGLVGLDEVPVVIRDTASIVKAAELAIVENVQRENLNVLEEAEAFRVCHEEMQQPVNEVARSLGVPVSRVRRRLRLLRLPEDVCTALRRGDITMAHADLLVQVPLKMTKDALAECRAEMLWKDAFEPKPLRSLQSWMRRHVKADVSDPESVVDYFPSMAEKVEEAEALPTMLALSVSTQVNADLDDKGHGLIGHGRWVEIGSELWGSKKKVPDCPHSQDGVVLHGGRPQVLKVCAKRACEVHRPKAKPKAPGAGKPASPVSDWAATQKRDDEERKRWDEEKPALMKAFAEHIYSLEIDLTLIRKTYRIEEEIQALQEMFGETWKPEEHLGQILVFGSNQHWNRKIFKESSEAWGFKVPARKKPAGVAAALAAAAFPKKKAAKKKAAKKTARKRAAPKKKAAPGPAEDAG